VPDIKLVAALLASVLAVACLIGGMLAIAPHATREAEPQFSQGGFQTTGGLAARYLAASVAVRPGEQLEVGHAPVPSLRVVVVDSRDWAMAAMSPEREAVLGAALYDSGTGVAPDPLRVVRPGPDQAAPECSGAQPPGPLWSLVQCGIPDGLVVIWLAENYDAQRDEAIVDVYLGFQQERSSWRVHDARWQHAMTWAEVALAMTTLAVVASVVGVALASRKRSDLAPAGEGEAGLRLLDLAHAYVRRLRTSLLVVAGLAVGLIVCVGVLIQGEIAVASQSLRTPWLLWAGLGLIATSFVVYSLLSSRTLSFELARIAKAKAAFELP
jgi:hypothetical protein